MIKDFKNNEQVGYEVNEIVQSISFINQFCKFSINNRNYPLQRDNYSLLKETATEEELITLIAHRNAVVRCYAFKCLVEKKSNVIPAVYRILQYDSEVVGYTSGCIISSRTVSKLASQLMPTPPPMSIVHGRKQTKISFNGVLTIIIGIAAILLFILACVFLICPLYLWHYLKSGSKIADEKVYPLIDRVSNGLYNLKPNA